MKYFSDVLFVIFLLTVYSVVHSFLASEKVKLYFKNRFGKRIAFYRLGYNLFAFAGLYLIWEFAPHPSLQIYKLPSPYDYLVLIPQLLAIAGTMWCFKYISFREFVGLNQIDLYLKGEYSEDQLDEKSTLIFEGPYKYSRHPLYFFLIIILLFRAEMDLFYLTMFVSFVAYCYAGSFYEEKKLVRLFGNQYKDYQKLVPRIIPVRFFN